MSRSSLGAVLGGVLLLGAARVAAAHPLHTTLTQLDYDARAHAVQITVRAFADDFGAAVARRTGVTPAADHGVPERAAMTYVLAAVTLADRDGRPVQLTWCGVKRTGDLLWVCLRAPAAGGVRGAQLRNGMGFDLYADQVNIVQASYDGRRQSLLFTRGDGAKRLP